MTVSLAEYILVLRVLFNLEADDLVYHGYCANCHHPAADDEKILGKISSSLFTYAFVRLIIELACNKTMGV